MKDASSSEANRELLRHSESPDVNGGAIMYQVGDSKA